MPNWTAVAFGALDLRGTELGNQGFELVVVPVRAATPIFLMGSGAAVWRSLVEGTSPRTAGGKETVEILSALEDMGVVSTDSDHPARVSALGAPWLVSPLHELVYALITHVARARDIEVVFIKGPTLYAQGLRMREHSGDVDCWVRPGEDLRLAEAMREWGWTPLMSPFTGTGVTHSLTLEAAEWGCAIDVHTRYPGIDLEAGATFDLVKSESERRAYAGVACLTPRKVLHGVIAALHSVRPFIGAPPGEAQLYEASLALRAAGPEVIRMAEQVNAVYALEVPLQRAFPEAGLTYPHAQPPVDWGWRMTASAPRRHLRALMTVPLRQRPGVLGRLVWPSTQMLKEAGEPLGTSHFRRAATRIRRVLSAALALARRS